MRRTAGVLRTVAGHARAGSGSLTESSRRALEVLDVRLDTDADRLSDPGDVGTLVVANHMSWLDILVLFAIEDLTFLAKKEVGRWPVIGGFAKSAGTVFIDRGSLRSLPGTVDDLARTLRAGRSVMLFPEATTWCSGGGPFRRAPFQAALDAGAPVRPVTLTYTQGGDQSTIAGYVGDDSLVASIGRVTRARELTVSAVAHPILPPEGDRRELTERAQKTVQARVRELPHG